MITMFKFFGYPFQIAKSSISAVGSPHAWPSLLAAIMWLVELLQYDMAVQQNSSVVADGDPEDPSVSERAFYRYLSKAYELFLAGKDEQYEKLEEQFVASFENKNVLIRDQIEALEQRNAALTQEIEAVKGRSAYLPELEAKKREFHSDHQKFLQLLDELKKHRDQLRSKVELRSSELDKLKAAHDRAAREAALLRERVSKQELSSADVANMVNERQRLEEAAAAASESRQSLQRRVIELEMALRDKVQYLEDTARAYHSIAADLQLIPQNARNARGEQLSIEIDIGAKKREGLIKTDIRTGVLPVLQELKKELSETTLSLRSELLSQQDIADEIDCKRSELLGGQEAIEAKLRRAEAAYRREKDLLDQGAQLHRQELEAMESRLLQLRDTAAEESALTAATRRLADIQTVRSERRQEHERMRAALVEAITEVIARCAGHRENAQRTLSDLKARYAARLSLFLQSAQPVAEAGAGGYEAVARSILAAPAEQRGKVSLRAQFHPSQAHTPSRRERPNPNPNPVPVPVPGSRGQEAHPPLPPAQSQGQGQGHETAGRPRYPDLLLTVKQTLSPAAVQASRSQGSGQGQGLGQGQFQLQLPSVPFPALEAAPHPAPGPPVPAMASSAHFQQHLGALRQPVRGQITPSEEVLSDPCSLRWMDS